MMTTIDENSRIKEVRKFLQFNFLKSREYQDITDLASQLCEKPISMITLLGEEVNWIKVATAESILSQASHPGWRIKANGEQFWGSVVVTATHNNKDEVIGFAKVTKDLTEEEMPV